MIRALILNDTARGGHIGCKFVMRNLKGLCADHNLHVMATLAVGPQLDGQMRRYLPDCDLVIINGEGTMHHDRVGAMYLTQAGQLASRSGKPIVLLNTVWEENNAANALLSCVEVVYARESRSAAAVACDTKIHVQTVPDLSLSTPSSVAFGSSRKCRGGVLVLDDVRLEACLLLAKYAKARSYVFRCMDFQSWRAHWRKQVRLRLVAMGLLPLRLRQARCVYDADIVVTGRFHGVCLAILAGKPFVALSSNTYKIEGLLDDAGLEGGGILLSDDRLVDDPFSCLDMAVTALQSLRHDNVAFDRYRKACSAYVERARAGHLAMFADVAALVHPRQEATG